MKTNRIPTLLGVVITVIGLDHAAHAQFNTLETWGNAVGTTPPSAFTATAGTFAITAGGADFYGNSDQGAFLWDNTGSQTTAGNFTASVRHVGTTNPAPQWGRDGVMVRATQSPGMLSANDANWLAGRNSDGRFLTNRRAVAGGGTFRATDAGNPADLNYNSDINDRGIALGNVTNTPYFLAAGRDGDRLYSGYAMDLGGTGVAGRWVEHWSTEVPEAVSGLQSTVDGRQEVVVGLAHQSHPQTISPDTNDINTATFDNWKYASTFDDRNFGPASSASTWTVAGSVSGNAATGQIHGSAYVDEGGAATGEPVKWTVSVYPLSSFVPKFGTSGTRKDLTPMDSSLAVPAENFRQGGDGSAPGLTIDLYTKAPNAGNMTANLALMTNPATTKSSTVIPSPYWNTGSYPINDGGDNIFNLAAPGYFAAAADNYGTEMKGQIFIPADADRIQPNLPGEFIIFKDGTDDFTYLEIDGRILFNDNDWTGLTSTDNGGGNLAVFDVSDPKYNDGQWVSFRMITWEGGGGDNVALYWGVEDASDLFTVDSVPGTFGNLVPKTGVANSRKDPTAMLPEDLVSPGDFRHALEAGGTAPGLVADIYPQGNPANIDAINTIVEGGGFSSSVVIPNINWTNTADLSRYPSNGAGRDIFAEAGVSLEADANSAYGNYGVNMTGEIFIPGDAQRTPLPVTGGNNLVLFKDGVDDFTYLEIDGQVLTSDNDWTGFTSADNGGGHVTLMDVSDPKFDDGEWVPFRMTTWEGGGGDSGALYWSARDTNASFGVSMVPGSSAPVYQATGSAQVGDEVTAARFGDLELPAGDWLLVLDVANTGTSVQRLSAVSIAGTPGAALELTNFSFDPANALLNLGFLSEAGSHYALDYSTGLQAAGGPAAAEKWNVVPTHSDILGAAGSTSIVPLNVNTLVKPAGLLPDAGKCFFRIRKL